MAEEQPQLTAFEETVVRQEGELLACKGAIILLLRALPGDMRKTILDDLTERSLDLTPLTAAPTSERAEQLAEWVRQGHDDMVKKIIKEAAEEAG